MKKYKPHFYLKWNPLLQKWWLVEFTLFSIKLIALLWKDKWDSPRVKRLPQLTIVLLNIELEVYFGTDDIWEKYLNNKYYKNA